MGSKGSKCVLTFDVGGSHISSGLCRLSDLQVLNTAEAPLTAVDSFEVFVDLIYRLGREAAGSAEAVEGASLAVPGPFEMETGVSRMEHKLKFLYGKDLLGALAERFGWERAQFRFLNDASAYLLGEVGAGSARGAARAAGLTLGTGIGSAFAIHGRSVTEGEGVPPGGEIWNLAYSGATVEDLISTRRLKADFAALTGENLEVAQIALSASHDPRARQVFESFGTHLGQVLRDVIAPFRPDMVVIGGGISRSASLFLHVAERQTLGLGFCVVTSALLDRAPLVGAAQFWREESARAHESDAFQSSEVHASR